MIIEYSPIRPGQRVETRNAYPEPATVVGMQHLTRYSDGVVEQWCIVRFDADGGELLIHPSGLQAL